MPNDPPRYLRDPVFGGTGTFGGVSMDVCLGPAAAWPTNYGSKTNSTSISSRMQPLHDRDPGKWVAGHLLNDNLGGDGTMTANLTPLTKTANRNHATYEGRIKVACDRADLYHRSNPTAAYWYGIHYWVAVAGAAFGDFKPYNKAPSHITINARLIQQDKVSGAITYVAGGYEPFDFTRIWDVEIHNEDTHLL